MSYTAFGGGGPFLISQNGNVGTIICKDNEGVREHYVNNLVLDFNGASQLSIWIWGTGADIDTSEEPECLEGVVFDAGVFLSPLGVTMSVQTVTVQ